jgi:hypothetical protein
MSGLDRPPTRRYSSRTTVFRQRGREPLMVQLITADFFDFTFLALVAGAIAIAIFIVWKNKQ